MRTLLLALALAAATVTPEPGKLAAAFSADGFNVVQQMTYGSGVGMRAASRNVTLRSTGQPKAAFFVSGSGYEMGFLLGSLAPNETEAMLVTYVNHIIVSLLDERLDSELSNSSDPAVRDAYQALCEAIGVVVVAGANASFYEQPAGTIPMELLDEMRGLVDGVHSVRPSSNVSLARAITLNYGMDWISALVYTGQIANVLSGGVQQLAKEGHVASSVARAAALLENRHVAWPAFCDAFGVARNGTKPAGGSVFARSFQLPTGTVFQDVASPIIYVPSDNGRLPLVAASAPGFVGAITAVNAVGVAMGVDTLRTGDANATRPGHDSILMVRAAVHAARNTSQLVEYVASRPRGLSWLFPASDAAGHIAILETGKYRADSDTVPDFATELNLDPTLQALLVPLEELNQRSPATYHHGVFVRDDSYVFPDWVLGFNAALFDLAGVPLANASSAMAPFGVVFSDFAVEDAAWSALGGRFYSPGRGPTRAAGSRDDLVLVSNHALVPQLRPAEMNFWASLIPGHAAQFRYDVLHLLLRANAAPGAGIDIDTATRLVSFLSPCPNTNTSSPATVAKYVSTLDIASGKLPANITVDSSIALCTPGFWTDTIDSRDPMSAIIEGSLTVADLQTQLVRFKTGYWSDGWIHLTLPNYL